MQSIPAAFSIKNRIRSENAAAFPNAPHGNADALPRGGFSALLRSRRALCYGRRELMFSAIRREFIYTFHLSVPITIGLLGQGLFGVIDTVMIGNMLGEHALAAATLGNNANWPPLLLAIGLAVAVPVLTSQARGAGRREDVPGILRHGLLISVGISVIGAALVCAFIFADGLKMLGQPTSVADYAKNFACIIALSVPAAAAFQVLKSFRDATGGQWLSLQWTLVGLGANVFLNWALMSGSLGFPNWGLEGAAAGTLFSRLISVAGISIQKKLDCRFRRGFSAREIRENLRVGVPSALHILFEAGLFILTPFFMGWISEASIAANQVVITLSSLVYMIPLGVSQALSIRVGEAFGQGDAPRIRVIFAGATLFTLALMGINAVAWTCFREDVPRLFNLGEEASALSATFLLIACAYMLFDGFQTIAAGTLRGLGDVRIIAGAAFVSYWLIGCPAALILAFPLGMNGAGVWIGLAAGLAAIALILGFRVNKNLSRKRVFSRNASEKN